MRIIPVETPSAATGNTLSLGARLALLAAILVADKILLNQFVGVGVHGLIGSLHQAQFWGARFLAALAAALLLFSYVHGGAALKSAAREMQTLALRPSWIAIHIALLGLLAFLTFWMFRPQDAWLSLGWMAALWVIVGCCAAAALVLVFAPVSFWRRLVRSLGIIWVYALLAALIGSAAMNFSQSLWAPTARVTFSAVAYLLSGVLPHLEVDSVTRVLRADHFAVEVTNACSGLEGIGLILAFLVCWLIYFRSEYRFPRALLLIPLGLLVMFGLNILRIAALLLIGNAGYPDVAMYGFHSQAGWISFILVSCGLAAFSRSSRFFNRLAAQERVAAAEESNPTGVYLLPLLAILAAGIVSHAISGKFETFYPLRLIAALAVLIALRRPLAAMVWNFSWRGFAMGVAVFGVWWAAARLFLPLTAAPEGYSALSSTGRWLWLGSRLVGSVLTVPLAEELAYRGYLMRRVQREDFDTLQYSEAGWLALAISSVAFGVMHGAMWMPGIVAGVGYALICKWRNSLGEAVFAHATTNALVALSVVLSGDWRLW
jgi:exosortase E/protease (VPEID-CTERM system)